METLISIDPGMSSAIVVGTYSDTQPYELTHAFQIEDGLEGFLKAVSVSHGEDWGVRAYGAMNVHLGGFKSFDLYRVQGGYVHETGEVCEDEECDCVEAEYDRATVICEKFKPRGAGNNFAYKTNDLEPLRIEGAIRAMGIDPVWVQPAQQYFAGGESKSSTTNAHRWLKENGLHITGKDVGCKDANDARSALLHSISYLRRMKHKPTIEKYFPRGAE